MLSDDWTTEDRLRVANNLADGYPADYSRERMNYHGITYFPLLDNRFCQWLWRLTCCRRQWHLFDEVVGTEHYLSCDACGLSVIIAGIEEP